MGHDGQDGENTMERQICVPANCDDTKWQHGQNGTAKRRPPRLIPETARQSTSVMKSVISVTSHV